MCESFRLTHNTALIRNRLYETTLLVNPKWANLQHTYLPFLIGTFRK